MRTQPIASIAASNREAHALALSLLSAHPEAVLLRCSDEKTGRRLGRRACRAGMCRKLGGGGRSPGSRVRPYQLWLSWAPADLGRTE